MRRKWMGVITLLLPVMGWSQVVPSSPTLQELNAIENELIDLNKKMHEMQIKELNDEVEGQGYMIADWSAYSREVKEIKDIKDQELRIQRRLEHLERRKAALLKQQENGR